MHKINVLAFGSENFNTSLEELKDYLNFKLTITNDNLENQSFENYDVLFIHEDYLKDGLVKKELLQQSNKIKILASNSNDIISGIFTDTLFLPTQIKDLNKIIEDSVIKKSFSKNSSIKIKDYILDKNEKKLIKDQNYILLTEKEIQLLELFLGKTQSISKNKILEKVWKYSTEADTHTVETHIYRLRKKIKSKFSDDSFILNDKNGYLL
jgi:DNA-binding response OmpR family regulator